MHIFGIHQAIYAALASRITDIEIQKLSKYYLFTENIQ